MRHSTDRSFRDSPERIAATRETAEDLIDESSYAHQLVVFGVEAEGVFGYDQSKRRIKVSFLFLPKHKQGIHVPRLVMPIAHRGFAGTRLDIYANNEPEDYEVYKLTATKSEPVRSAVEVSYVPNPPHIASRTSMDNASGRLGLPTDRQLAAFRGLLEVAYEEPIIDTEAINEQFKVTLKTSTT